MENSIQLQGIVEIPAKLKWNNSANILCNYMKKLEYLEMILKNKAIIPRYVIEPLLYLKIEGLHKIAFPMTCFCDIPLSKVGGHMSHYGRYGIALDKQAIISKFRVQPIHYMNPDSPLVNDFRRAFSDYYNTGKKVHPEDKVLLNYLMSAIMYMKPISGIEKIAGEEKPYIFQDECEWRYIPTENFPQDLKLMLAENTATENAKNYYSKALLSHEETWIKFDWEDIRYIIVPDEVALKRIIEIMMELPLGVSFDPAAEFPHEDAVFLSELKVGLLERKDIKWNHPFNQFHVSKLNIKSCSIDDVIGKEKVSMNFFEGPINATLFGATFELYSETEMRDFIITSVEWDDESKTAGDLYIADEASGKSWVFIRKYLTAREAEMKKGKYGLDITEKS